MRCLLLPAVAMVTFLVRASQGQQFDATLVSGAFGAEVVNAIVDRIRSKCLFANDRLFLRRAAYVMSRDGTDSTTYRPGYHGGIWQIDVDMFDRTLRCDVTACQTIQENFGFDWKNVTWTDLRKPLYSGMAAAIYTMQQLNGRDIAGDVEGQAAEWAVMYNKSSTEQYINEAPRATKLECSSKMDLAFILDSSGSISDDSFALMLNFTADVVDVMNIKDDVVRVTSILFSSDVRVEFDLADYAGNPEDLSDKIISASRRPNRTYTDLGLDKAAQVLFNSTGARSDAKKVAALITDGKSTNKYRTLISAAALRDKGTTVFAIGVQNADEDELNKVASRPTCTHVMKLPDFSVIRAILTEIQKSTCEANAMVTAQRSQTGIIAENGTRTATTVVSPSTDKEVRVTTDCGILNLYASTKDPKPSSAIHEHFYRATDRTPAVLSFVDTLPSGTPVYVTVEGTRLPAEVAELKNCSDYTWTLEVAPKKDIKVTCTEDGFPRPCTTEDIMRTGLCEKDEREYQTLANPCTVESMAEEIMRHPYPFDSTKFLQCDMRGNVYVTSCPNNVIFNTNTLECGFTAPGVGSFRSTRRGGTGVLSDGNRGELRGGPLPQGYPTPCTRENITKNVFYHAYTPDKEKFIQCDEWGRAWLMPCAPGTQWSQLAYTCVHKPKVPARSGVVCTSVGQYIANPCNHTTFYHCDAGLSPQKKDCPSPLFWDPFQLICDWTDKQLPSNC